LHVLYDEACLLAEQKQYDAALAKLARAAGLESNRDDARTDPWFAPIRSTLDSSDADHTAAVQQFWEIVGAPTPAFTDLPPFGEKGSALRELGVNSAQDLLAVTVDEGAALADALKLPKTVTAAWRAFARLAAARTGRERFLNARELALLVALGIRNDEDLRGYSSGTLGNDLVEKAQELGLRPPTNDEATEIAATRPADQDQAPSVPVETVSPDGEAAQGGGFFPP
jgi:hypothetical protein